MCYVNEAENCTKIHRGAAYQVNVSEIRSSDIPTVRSLGILFAAV